MTLHNNGININSRMEFHSCELKECRVCGRMLKKAKREREKEREGEKL